MVRRKAMGFILTGSLMAVLLTGCFEEVEITPMKTKEQKVQLGNLEVGLPADGRISRSLTNLNFEMSGTVKEIHVEEGQTVSTGEIIAELESADVALTNSDKVYIKAPIEGKVLDINFKVGEMVTGSKTETQSSSGSSTSSNASVILMDPSVIYVKSNITESDISGIELGQQMRLTIDPLSLENVAAEVIRVSELPNIDSSGIVTYEVVGKLTETNPAIKEGMTTFLTYLKKEKKDVLMVPNKAIFIDDGKQYVNVKSSEGEIEKRLVAGGLSNGVNTEVMEGLKEGETIIIGGVVK
ncbi:efflux RND transporter periplasmic adaptor subunit [Paenibacillus sp. CMAA1364]